MGWQCESNLYLLRMAMQTILNPFIHHVWSHQMPGSMCVPVDLEVGSNEIFLSWLSAG
jgi:hypothetical protein